MPPRRGPGPGPGPRGGPRHGGPRHGGWARHGGLRHHRHPRHFHGGGAWFRGGPWIAPWYEMPAVSACGFALPNGDMGPWGMGYYRGANGRVHPFGPGCEPLEGLGWGESMMPPFIRDRPWLLPVIGVGLVAAWLLRRRRK